MRVFCPKAARPVAILALAGLAACGSSGSGDATPPISQGIGIALSGSSIGVQQGQSNTMSVTVTRTGGYAGGVSLSLESAPTGVTGTFTPQSLTGTATTATLLITAAANAATATTNVTVRATGTGVTAQTASLAITIVAAPIGGFTMSLSQNALTLLPGTSGNVTVNVSRATPFSGAVSVAASGLPANVTMSPSPANITGANTQLTFTVGSSVAVGNYPITLRGTGTGVPDQQATVTLQVVAATGGTSVTVTFCQADAPIWVGSQSETGPWIRASATASNANAYTFNINNRGGFAAVFDAGSGAFAIEVTYGTATELANSGTQCSSTFGNKTVSGTVASLAAAESAYVSLGASEAGRRGPGAFQLTDVGEGPLELIALRYALTPTSATPTKGVYRRNVNQAGGSAIPALDFAAAEAFDPASATLSIGNLGSDDPFVLAYMSTANGGTNAYYFGGLFGGGATQPWYGIPESRLGTGDLHNVLTYGINANGDQFRVVYLWTRQVTNRTITLGPAVSAPAFSVVGTTPNLRHRVQFTRQAEYSQGAIIEYDQSNQTSAASVRTLSIQASAAYFGGNPTTWDLTTPDLSAAAGFLATWGLQSGVPSQYIAGGIGGSGDINASPTDGTLLSIGYRLGNVASSEAPPAALNVREFGRQLRPGLPFLPRRVRR
jgi:hypothetical protein